MDIPPHLIERVKSGDAVLILGAGASLEATAENGDHAPGAGDLRDKLCDKFLGGKLKGRTLSHVAECAISETNLVMVQDFIRQTFTSVRPTASHLMVPTFRWWGLATTNYDHLIEEAYEKAIGRAQTLVPLIENGDLVDRYARDPVNVLLLKLHGCITRTANPACPLILTIDQYIDHRTGRSRLFELLTDWGYEHPLVFIGHSLQDPDIRQLLKDLTKNATARSRYYCVVPDADPIEQRALEQHRITVLPGTFAEFVSSLDVFIPSPFRGIAAKPPTSPLPIAMKFRDSSKSPSSNLIQFLTIDCEYVSSINATTIVEPKSFYKGFNPGFSAIEQGLDVRRGIGDEILSDVFLINEAEHKPKTELVLIKAHAGAGKTVLLHRLAWDAARDYDCICLFLKPAGLINPSAIQELIELCDRRVYVFVDDAADKVRELEALLDRIGATGRLLTIIAAERLNEWNIVCQALNTHVTDVYEVKYLTTPEIDSLLKLLALHKAEGALEGLSVAEKQSAFVEIAGRQLLVALHEATLGTPFRQIIQNEFDNIWPLEAKQIYLTICTLNRLNVPVRAGIVARLHGIAFTEFKDRFFEPLEHIVQAELDPVTRDYVYRARHPYIAQMVFEDVLRKQEERFDLYIRCLGALNLDYSPDRIAFRQMTRAKTVLELFSSHELSSEIYTRAQERAGTSDGVLLHQLALYELNRPNGSLTRSAELLTTAMEVRKHDPSLKHSFAELHLRIAESARTELEKAKHLTEATTLCRGVIGKSAADSYAFVTLAKIGLLKLDDALESANAISIEQTVKDVEGVLRDGLQRFPTDSYLREAEARLAERIADSDRAVAALQKAFQTNPRSTFIALRLSQSLRNRNDNDAAREVLETALGASNNAERRLHYAYARLLISQDASSDRTLYHLQRSFAPSDTNYDAQLLYARQLYLNGNRDAAFDLFRTLKNAQTSPETKFAILYPLDEVFHGEISRMEASYCFITRDGISDRVYAHRDNVGESWSSLAYRKRVSFKFGFAFGGPTAFEVRLDSPGQ